MNEILIEIGRCWLEMNVEKSKMMGISRQTSPMHIMVDQTQAEYMDYLNYVRSITTNDARCTQEVKSRIAMPNAFQQEEGSFHQQFGLKFKEETIRVPHLENCFVWCWNLNTSESTSQMPGKFWNVVFEMDREDQLDRSCWIWRNTTNKHGGEEYPANNK